MNDRRHADIDTAEAARRLRAVLDHTFEFIGMVGPDGTLLEANAAALRFAGASRSQVIGRSFSETPWWHWSAEQQAQLNAGVARAVRNEFVRFEAAHRAADGSIEVVDFSLNPVVDQQGKVMYLIAEGRRITERKRLETALQVHTQELEAAKAAAERADRAKSQFLAAASHDLRQPLQTLALVHAILARIVKDDAAEVQLHTLAEAIRTMDNLLAALLDINRLESGDVTPTLRTFPLEQLLAPIRCELEVAARDKGLQLLIRESTAQVRSDPRLLDVILRNLVANAIKYTNAGSVRLDAMHGGDGLHIEVVDTGSGIAPEHLERIFDDYYQVDNAARERRRGVGLGLAIVRRISSLLAHPIGVRSTIGVGSVFTIDVPLAAGAAPQTTRVAIDKPTQCTAQANGKLTILHVEDDPDVAASLRMLLQVEGYHVVLAASRVDALKRVRDEGLRPDLIITDYQLPGGITGDEVVAEVAGVLGARPPTILLTGDISEQRRRSLRECVDRVLEKPADAEELLQALRALSPVVVRASPG